MNRNSRVLKHWSVFVSTLAHRPRRTRLSSLLVLPIALGMFLGIAGGQTMWTPDITKVPTLFVVPYAHLDTQYRWEIPQSIVEYMLKTMRVNFDYMDKYPHYVFNWTGANRYRLMKEYFPNDYARVKQYVAKGQWYPAGSSVEEGDVNLPSAEGIFRQILYGNTYFRNEFGKASDEFMLPDCFGFPASLPSILAAAGIKGFSTQKLSAVWQPSPKVGGPDSPEETPAGIPFNVGIWVGPDGKTVLAALNPGGYSSNVYTDLSLAPPPPLPPPQLTSAEKAKVPAMALRFFQQPREIEQNWVTRIALDGMITGVYADYKYVGTGDTGGAALESTVKLLEAIVTQSKTVMPGIPRLGVYMQGITPPPPAPTGPAVRVGEGPIHVVEATADQMFNAITPDLQTRMPRYTGDLELINHSAGSLTSEAYHKRWIIKNEGLADAAEKASVAAAWMGGRPYPQKRLNNAWVLELAGHFHDTGAGTTTPRAYQYAWNDDLIAANLFGTVLTSATESVASVLNTQGKGMPIVVYNPLNIERQDLVEAEVPFAHGMPKAVRVAGADGKLVPAQLEQDGKVLFLARVPSVGYAVYDVQAADAATPGSELHVTPSTLENARYAVKLDANGDVSSIFDKSVNKELLSAPIRLAISTDEPTVYPAWNMDFDQEQAAPRTYVGGPANIRVKERGPARVSIEVSREAEGSKFVQTISLAAGDAGNHVEFANAIDWRTTDANLKETFSFTASNPDATYNWDVGTIQRPNAYDRSFEVASHRWIDLTDKSGTYGATILTDCKNGSDKPNDNTIRLTLMRSPGILPESNDRSDQGNQDWGHHEFVFGLAGHAGDWREGQTDWQGYRLNDPLIAFETTKHSGSLGKTFSLVHLNDSRIRVLALKKAEADDEVIVRMVELDGKAHPGVRVTFAGPVTAAREVNAQELPLGDATVADGSLATTFTPYQPRTFALKLGAPPATLAALHSEPVKLNYDLAVATNDDTKTVGGGIDGKGSAIPAEMLPETLRYNGAEFDLAPAGTGKLNAVVAKGQSIELPKGKFNRIYILAASSDGDQAATFRAGRVSEELNIQDWTGFVGQWDTRVWKNEDSRDWATSGTHAPWPPPDFHTREERTPSPRYPEDYLGLKAGYVKQANLGWYASHHHTADGLNEPYQYSYLFAYTIDVPADAPTLTLPNNDKVRVLAVSVGEDSSELKPAAPLFDTLGRSEPPTKMEEAGMR